MIFRAVKADKKKQGYQFIAYMDKTTSRLQIILDDIVPDNNWRLCADGAVLSMHKVKVRHLFLDVELSIARKKRT